MFRRYPARGAWLRSVLQIVKDAARSPLLSRLLAVSALAGQLSCGGEQTGERTPSRPVPGERPFLATYSGVTAESILAKAAAPAGSTEFVPPESVILRNAMARAKNRGRPLLVEVSGAWCAPCRQFNLLRQTGDEAISAGEFSALMERFEFLYLEDEFLANSMDFSFLPLFVEGVPAFLTWNPKTGVWAKAGWDGTLGKVEEGLRTALAAFERPDGGMALSAADPALDLAEQEKRWKKFAADVRAGRRFELEDTPNELALVGLLTEMRGIPAALEFAAEVAALAKGHGWYAAQVDLRYLKRFLVKTAIQKKGVSFTFIERDFPVLAAEVRPHASYYVFTYPLDALVASKGVAVAASICRELNAFVGTRYPVELKPVPPSAGAAERKRIENENSESRENGEHALLHRLARCATLEARSRVGDLKAVSEFVHAQDAAWRDDTVKVRLNHAELLRLAAAAGEFEVALSVAERAHAEIAKENVAGKAQATAKIRELEAQSGPDDEARSRTQQEIGKWRSLIASLDERERLYDIVLIERRRAFSQRLASPLLLHELFH